MAFGIKQQGPIVAGKLVKNGLYGHVCLYLYKFVFERRLGDAHVINNAEFRHWLVTEFTTD